MELLTYRGGALGNMKKNKLVYLLLPIYALSNFINMFFLLLRFRFKIVNVHWIVPSGFIAVFLKPFFRFKLVLTSHGGDIFGFRNDKIFNRVIRLFLSFALNHAESQYA